MKLRLIVLSALSVIGLAACASTTVSTAPVQTGTAKAVAKTTTAAKHAAVAHVGSTVAVSGIDAKLNVQLAAVMDPAAPDNSFDAPPAGKRLVGLKFVITNTGSKAVTDDIYIDASVIGSDNQTYSAELSTLAGCTSFSSGQFTLAPGAAGTGCAPFTLPTAVKVVQVQFKTQLGVEGATGQWNVP